MSLKQKFLRALSLLLLVPLVAVADLNSTTKTTLNLPRGILKLDKRPAPALSLSNMDGEIFDLKNYRGRWVFIHFWASWCSPCRREIPEIDRLIKKTKQLNIDYMLVNTSESEDTVFEFISAVAPDLNILLDTEGVSTEQWQPRGLPASFFIDPQGRLQYIALGGRNWNMPEYFDFVTRVIKE